MASNSNGDSGESSSSSRARKGVKGDLIDVKPGSSVVDPIGNVRTMGGSKYVLDQVGRHHVDGTAYDVTERED